MSVPEDDRLLSGPGPVSKGYPRQFVLLGIFLLLCRGGIPEADPLKVSPDVSRDKFPEGITFVTEKVSLMSVDQENIFARDLIMDKIRLRRY